MRYPANGVLSEPVRVRGAVTQPGAAERDGRFLHLPPERPDRRRYPKFDAGVGMLACQIIDGELIDRVHRLVGDPVAAHVVRSERLGWHPVGVEAAILHAPQPAGLHDMDPVRGALPEEPFTILRRGGRYRPDASSRTIPREPEHGCVTGINRPYQRRSLLVRGRRMRAEPAKKSVLTEMPQGERAFPFVWWRWLTCEQMLRI